MRLVLIATVLLCSAPAAAESFVPRLHSTWLETAAADATTPRPQVLDWRFDAKKRTKKGKGNKGKKGGGSSTTLEYGAMTGRVAPMDKFIGVGVQLGAPTGVTGKLMFDKFGFPQLGVVGGIGAGIGWVATLAFSIYLDLVYHPHVLARSESFKLSWFVGGGIWMGIAPLNIFSTRGNQEIYFGFPYMAYFGLPWYGTSVGIRMPLGVSLGLNFLPIEIYGELDPAILVFPAIGGGIGASVGLRFWL